MALTMDNKNFRMEQKIMTQETKIPNVHQLLEATDSDPIAHMLADALPKVLATGLRAWQSTELSEQGLEGRIEWAMNAMAAKVMEIFDS